MRIPAARFKADCLRLMDEVARTGRPVVITKHGRPVAQLAPVPAEAKSLFGYMKATVTIDGDIVGPTNEAWEAESGRETLRVQDAPRRPRPRSRNQRG